ncbi:MAG: glycosyltransferase family 2 protein [Solirubrobacteraceae bacterium]
MSAPFLSVVVPVYNEPGLIGAAVKAISVAVQESPFAGQTELVVVDDGSSTATVAAIDVLSAPFPIHVLRQANLGRFMARHAGIEAATGDYVLLIDARVRIAPDALVFIASQLPAGRVIWNAHVDIDMSGNPFARFWNVLTEVGFREYFSNPRTVSFDQESFDRFPKGTTAFLAPRGLLLEAIANFTSLYDDPRHASDDTKLIRWMAGRERVWISPRFRCVYLPRDAFRPFLRHAYHRGTVFPDSFGPGTRFFPVVAAFYPLSAGSLALALRNPKAASRILVITPLAAGAITLAVRRSIRDALTLGALAPIFTVVYGAGMWRGLALLTRARYSRAHAGRPR